MKQTSKFFIALFTVLFLAIAPADAQKLMENWRPVLEDTLKLEVASMSAGISGQSARYIKQIHMELYQNEGVDRLLIQMPGKARPNRYTIFPYYMVTDEYTDQDGNVVTMRDYKAMDRSGIDGILTRIYASDTQHGTKYLHVTLNGQRVVFEVRPVGKEG